VHKQGIICYT
ncbi:hypothetical protein CP8484711_0422B, partial [Chlamydia psittaci 84-8471/1]